MFTWFTKFQADFIKGFPKMTKCFWAQDDEFVYLPIAEASGVVLIPRKLCLVSTEALKAHDFPEQSAGRVKKLMGKDEDYMEATVVGTVKNGKSNLVQLRTEDGAREALIPEKQYKLLPKDAAFAIAADKFTPVRFYGKWGQEPTGFIMPVVHGGGVK